MYRNWYDNGCCVIENPFDNTGSFLSLNSFNNICGLNVDFLTYNGLLHAILIEWKHTIRVKTSTFAFKINATDSDLCCFCDTSRETILHFFW